MSQLTETEVIDRHIQALGEGHRACQFLGRQADPDFRAPRGKHYIALKEALELLEGSARQMGTFRSDARWIRLAALYGRARLKVQPKFMMEKWAWFGKLTELFEIGQRHIADLRDLKTGVLSGTPILPKRASEWAQQPDYKPVLHRPGTLQ